MIVSRNLQVRDFFCAKAAGRFDTGIKKAGS